MTQKMPKTTNRTAASDSNAQNNTENSSKGGANTSSVSGAKNNSSSSSSYNNISSSNTSNNSTSTSQVLEPFSKDNDSDKLLLIKISHYSHISDKHKHFQQSLQMVTAATLSGKLNRSSSQFQHRKQMVQRVPLILHGIKKQQKIQKELLSMQC